MGHAKYMEKRILERDAGVGGTASRPIVVEEDAEPEEDDDTRMIGELIRLAEDLGYLRTSTTLEICGKMSYAPTVH